MKRAIAILLTACLVFCMAGCVSQSDLDAALAERDALQAENNTLWATVDKYSDIIGAMDSEDYQAAMAILSEKQIAKEIEQKGNIDDYLVTVELTMDNFDDYFQWKTFYGINDFGEVKKDVAWFVLTSKAYDQGLVLYHLDGALGYTYTATGTTPGWGTHSNTSDENTADLHDYSMPSVGSGMGSDSVMDIEKCSAETTRVTGTATFVKAEYVTSYELGEVQNGAYQQATIKLVNGETLHRGVSFECKY